MLLELSAISLSDSWITGLTITAIAIAAYFLSMWVGMIVWAYRDASSRTSAMSERLMLTGLVAVFFIPGLVLYLALRPPELTLDVFNRHLEAEAAMRDMQLGEICSNCSVAVGTDFLFCPSCRTELRRPCSDCGRALRLAWTTCPYCGQEREAAAATRFGPVRQPAVSPNGAGALAAPASRVRHHERVLPATTR